MSRLRALLPCILALAPVPAHAQGIDLLSADTLHVALDVRAAAVGGERSWTDGGFGKLRFGSGTEVRLAEGAAIWQPRFGWALSGTVVALVQDKGGEYQPGLSEAYLSWKPLGGGRVKWSARAGLMWPQVSLEHEAAEWRVAQTITPSAINSWIGEEVKVVGAEGSASVALGRHRITATAALFGADDTAGALLAFRGWALHDLKGLAGRTLPLPELAEEAEYIQPRYTHPLMKLDGHGLSHPGAYAKLTWQGPWPVRAEFLHYDNRGDPEIANAFMEWVWATRFDHVGIVAEPAAGWHLTAQALTGRTRMGPVENGRRWIDTRFRSAFALVTRDISDASLSARLEAFGTRARGSYVGPDDGETGWAATLAGRKPIGEHTMALVELLHVSSHRDARERDGLSPRLAQTQLQGSIRLRW